MSGLAKILLSMGKKIIGSDCNRNEIIYKLKQDKVKIYNSHNKKHIKDVDLVVYSGAIKSDNVELQEARQRGILTIERSQLLYLISKEYKNVIAISGTHGKTTTTAMIAYIFFVSGLNPTIHLGGEASFINGNVRIGGNDFFITEACEYRNSFLALKPDTSVITNIEPEHLDFFKSFDNERKSFQKFISKTNGKCFISKRYDKFDNKNILTYGISHGDFFAKNIVKGDDNKYIFDLFQKESFIDKFKVNIYGMHNVENAIAAISVCLSYGIDSNVIKTALRNFENAKRRFETIGLLNGNITIHDYAHHPTEILKTINTCKEVFNKDIVCVFQPHTYSRTKFLIEEFKTCFCGIKKLFIMDTYSAREKFDFYGSAKYLGEVLKKNNINVIDCPFEKKDILNHLSKENDCVFLFLGAGDIELFARKIVKKFR